MPDDTRQLTAAIAAGEPAAIDLFFRQYFDFLYRQARRASQRDEAFALDVVQEAVLRIVRLIRPVTTQAQLRAWLVLVVRTTAFSLLRAEQRRERREAGFAMAAASSTACENTQMVANDLARFDWLQQKLAAFDPQLVALIELRYQQGWTLRRIAESLHLSVGTIDGRLRRALDQLRHRAAQDLGEDFDE